MLFWAGNFVLGRGVAGHVPPIALSWFRWIFAFLILFPFTFSYVVKDWPVIRQNIPVIILLGVLGVGCFNTFAYIGLNHTTAINALTMQSSGPVLIMLVAFFFFGEKVSRIQMLGILISLPGVLSIIAKGDWEILANMSLNIGDAWVLTAITCWAFYTVLLRLKPDIHWLSFASITFGVGSLFVTPFFIGEMILVKVPTFDVTTFLAVLYVSVFPSILAYIFYSRGVELIGASRAGAFLHLVPMFGGALAILLLGEVLKPYHIIGFSLIMIGVFLASRTGTKVSANR